MMHIIPNTLVDAFAKGEILQVVFVAVLFGIALSAVGSRCKPLVDLLESLTDAGSLVYRFGRNAYGYPHDSSGWEALILGIDRFMSMFRALINMVANGVATLVITRREKSLIAKRWHIGSLKI